MGCRTQVNETTRRRAAGGALVAARSASAPATAPAGASRHAFERIAVRRPCAGAASLAGGGAEREGTGASGGKTPPPTDRKALFCHQCEQKKTLKVAFYLQARTTTSEDNAFFAQIFLMGRNVDLQIEKAAGVIPTVYDEAEKKYGRVESVASLCDVLKGLETQGTLPKAGALPAVFVPFGKQLRTSAGDTLGWHLKDVNTYCQDHVGPLKATRIVLIDSDPEVQHPKVLLHEIGHAVGNGDLADAAMIMGPADPSGEKKPPIGCQPDAKDNLMTAAQVKKFCAASF